MMTRFDDRDADSQTSMASLFRANTFAKRCAVVTGGGSGIGKAIAKDLLTLGCNVVIAARKEERLIEAMAELREAAAPAAEIRHYSCNIREEESVRGLMRYATQEFGALDFLVNVSWPLEVHLTARLSVG